MHVLSIRMTRWKELDFSYVFVAVYYVNEDVELIKVTDELNKTMAMRRKGSVYIHTA